MIDFGKPLFELEDDLNNILEDYYDDYLENGLYLQLITDVDINTYLIDLYRIGYVDINELNSNNTYYLFNEGLRSLYKIKDCNHSLEIDKYIIDYAELKKYIYYKK